MDGLNMFFKIDLFCCGIGAPFTLKRLELFMYSSDMIVKGAPSGRRVATLLAFMISHLLVNCFYMLGKVRFSRTRVFTMGTLELLWSIAWIFIIRQNFGGIPVDFCD